MNNKYTEKFNYLFEYGLVLRTKRLWFCTSFDTACFFLDVVPEALLAFEAGLLVPSMAMLDMFQEVLNAPKPCHSNLTTTINRYLFVSNMLDTTFCKKFEVDLETLNEWKKNNNEKLDNFIKEKFKDEVKKTKSLVPLVLEARVYENIHALET